MIARLSHAFQTRDNAAAASNKRAARGATSHNGSRARASRPR
jgi:hypothetical protein